MKPKRNSGTFEVQRLHAQLQLLAGQLACLPDPVDELEFIESAFVDVVIAHILMFLTRPPDVGSKTRHKRR